MKIDPIVADQHPATPVNSGDGSLMWDVNVLLQNISEARRPYFVQVGGSPRLALSSFMEKRGIDSPISLAPISRIRNFFERIGWAKPTPRQIHSHLIQNDNELLARLQKAEYLKSAPQVGNHILRDGASFDMAYCLPSGLPGLIVICSDLDGNRKDSVFGEDVDKHSLRRWLVLLHEASHCEFAGVSNPFTPSVEKCPPEVASALSMWTFSPFVNPTIMGQLGRVIGDTSVNGSIRDSASGILDECFADVYSSMMLLKITGFSEDAKDVVEATRVERLKAREKAEKTWIECGDMFSPHKTDAALSTMLASIDQWKDLSPDEMKGRALQIASDAVLDLCMPSDAPARLTNAHRNLLSPGAPSLRLVWAWVEIARATPKDELLDVISKAFGSHPVMPHVKSFLENLSSKVDYPNAKHAAMLKSEYLAKKNEEKGMMANQSLVSSWHAAKAIISDFQASITPCPRQPLSSMLASSRTRQESLVSRAAQGPNL